jgi:hypothetical protein
VFGTGLHQIIAQALADGAPAGWQALMVDAEVGDDFIDMGLKAQSAAGIANFVLPDREQMIVEDAILALRKEAEQGAHDPWSHCTVSLSADGDFKIDLRYDVEG